MVQLSQNYETILKELTDKIIHEVGLQAEDIQIKENNSQDQNEFRAKIKIASEALPANGESMSFEIWSTEAGSLYFESDKELLEYEIPDEKKALFDDVLFYYNYERDRLLKNSYRS